jgi:hypothetical protein
VADKKLTYRIGAADDASAVFSKISGTAKREMGKVSDALEDGESAGKRFARVLSGLADDLTDELRGAERAADSLANALGPEMASKVGRNGIDGFVQDMRRAGLTFDDIEGDADELAASIRKLDDVASTAGRDVDDAFGRVTDGTDRVEKGAERAHGAMGSFIGGTVGELPGVSSAISPIGESLGQLAEAAFSAEVSLGQVAAVAGPIAAVGAAIAIVSKITNDHRRREEQAAAAAQEYADALRDQSGALREVANEVTANNFLEDAAVTRALDMGASVRVLADAVNDSTTDFGALSDAVRIAQGNIGGDFIPSMDDLRLTFDNAGMSADPLVQQILSLADTGHYTSDQLVALIDALGGFQTAMETGIQIDERRRAVLTSFGLAVDDTTDSTDELTAATDESTSAFERHRDALRANFDPLFAAIDANDQLAEAQAHLADVQADTEASAQDLADAQQEVTRAALDVEGAQDDLRRAMSDGTVSIAGSRAQLQQWVAQGKINQQTADAVAAAIEGVGNEARALDGSSANVLVRATTADAVRQIQQIQQMIHGIDNSVVDIQVVSGRRAAGGPVSAGQAYVVGENRPELFVPDSDGTILPSVPPMAQPAAFGAATGGSQTIVLQVNLNRRVIAEEVLDEFHKLVKQGYSGPWVVRQ